MLSNTKLALLRGDFRPGFLYLAGGCNALILAADRELRDTRGSGRTAAVVANVTAFEYAVDAPLDRRTNCVRAGAMRVGRIPVASTNSARSFADRNQFIRQPGRIHRCCPGIRCGERCVAQR